MYIVIFLRILQDFTFIFRQKRIQLCKALSLGSKTDVSSPI